MDDLDALALGRWAAGDRAAGAELVERWFAAIARFFRGKVRDSIELQDDLVQATFAALLEAAPRFRGEGTFRSFLFTIAYNTLRKHYEHARRDERIDFGTVSVHDLEPGPLSQIAERAEQALVLAALQRLPLELQTALELFYWESLTAAEIGAALGMPEGTVKTRLRRARTLLRELVEAASADPATRAAALASIAE